MFYTKNLSTLKRIIRVTIGIAALAYVYQNWGVSNYGVVIGLAATMLAMTGLFGFCPMCAMAGKKTIK